MGVAYKISKLELIEYLKTNELYQNVPDSEIFYPHVLTKNVVFEMNFGQRVSLIGDLNKLLIKLYFLTYKYLIF